MPGRGKQLFLSLLGLDCLQLSIIYMPTWHMVGLLTQNPSLFSGDNYNLWAKSSPPLVFVYIRR